MSVLDPARHTRSIALLTFSLFLGVTAPLQTASASAPPSQGAAKKAKPPAVVTEKKGAHSRALLLRAWKLDAQTAARQEAPDGLGFEFLFVRQPSATGLFSLAELRDFTIDGQSYQAMTETLLKKRFEPGTELFDPKDVLATDGRTLEDAFGVSTGKASVMRTVLWGAPLPKKGSVKVTVQIGWGQQLEKLEFVLDLANLKTAPLPVRPVP
ncbi:hypothetical protein [Hyalangium minutum]|uniref:Uncharacterized protein n=1 Tax=Hyalangium minutum TaxID=394096 RepID=A0A085WQV3_9BACT|nr:hypothetical protein [Hyalangium minutum]KFE70066.1 hypothetical protein DB31_5108 [Hyalangium minutum]